jgi:deoxyribose-phosphate aldolase
MNDPQQNLAATIDHTLLAATTSSEDIDRLCEEAIRYGFAAVCVNPRWIDRAADQLQKTPVKVGSVAGFPLGADLTKVKVLETKEAIRAGADEIDFVADLAAIVAGERRFLLAQFDALVRVCHAVHPYVTLKAILETAALNEEQIAFACDLAQTAGIDFIKTSTGLHPAGGATVEAVHLMVQSAPHCSVKAAGGIRTADQARVMLAAGAKRIGTSAGVAIVTGPARDPSP